MLNESRAFGGRQWLSVLLLALTLAACGGGGGDSSNSGGDGNGGGGNTGGGSTSPVASIEISPEGAIVGVGVETSFYAFGKDSSGKTLSNVSITWSSSDTGIFTIDTATGVATGVSKGSASLSASSGQVKKTITVKVVEPREGKVFAGSSHACGLTTLGVAYCWGSNQARQLGANTIDPKSNRPLPVQGGHSFIDLALGRNHSCGLADDGVTWCWGSNLDKQLGVSGVVGEYGFTSVPVKVETEQRFVQLSAFGDRTCGLTATGEVWCWPNGDIYFGSTIDPIPARVVTDIVFTEIDVGAFHACGLTASGAAYCWGLDNNGQLGAGTHLGYSETPVAVTGGLTFAEISTGGFHTCGITTAGKAYCWGSPYDGLLGIGDPIIYHWNLPLAVLSDLQFTQIGASNGHTIALDTTGKVHWWGSYEFSDCTLDDVMNGGSCPYYAKKQETPLIVSSSSIFTQIAAGSSFNIGLLSDGRAAGWWGNSEGQVGAGGYSLFVSSPMYTPADYHIRTDDEAIVVAPGETETMSVEVERFGSFTTEGAGYSAPITLNAPYLPAGVTATFMPPVLGPTQNRSVVTFTAAENATPGRETISVTSTSEGGPSRAFSVLVRVPMPDNGGPYDLVCAGIHTELPDGFHCMDNGYGDIAPGKYKYPDMWGWWVNSEIGLCLDLGKSGYSYGRYRAPQIGGGPTTVKGPSQWGIIVRKDGTPEGSETQWYLFVGAADAQTQLVGYDSSLNKIMGWNFQKQASCPW